MGIPQDNVAERALLASLALEPDTAGEIGVMLPQREAFHDRKHQALFVTLLGMAREGIAVDPVTVTAELMRLGELQHFKGRQDAEAYVLDICKRVPTTRNYAHYAAIVKRLWGLRSFQAKLAELQDRAGHPSADLVALNDEVQMASLGILRMADIRPTQRFGDVSERVLNEVSERHDEARRLGEGVMLGLPTGIPGLSDIISGLREAQFIIGGGAPGWGKSTLMMQMADAIAETAPTRHEGSIDVGGSYIFSMEMPATELVAKTLFGHAGVDSQVINAGEGSAEDLVELQEGHYQLRNRRIFIDDFDEAPWPTVKAAIMRAYEEYRIEVAFIDYLQKIPKPPRMEMRHHVAEVSRGCKALAKRLGIPIVGMAQLKRKGGSKTKPPRPSKEDLAESAYLDRDADTILLLWPRAEFMRPRRVGWVVDPNPHVRERFTIVVDKNRGGRVGDVSTVFNKTLGRFEPPPGPEEQEWINAATFQAFRGTDGPKETEDAKPKEKSPSERQAEAFGADPSPTEDTETGPAKG